MLADAVTIEVAALMMVGAAWLAVAVWAVIRSARIGAQAELAQAWGLRLRGLLATSHVAYLIVGEGGRVTVSDRLRSWLALDGPATQLAELGPGAGCGIEGSDFTALEAAIEAASVSGVPFSLPVRTVGSNRLLRAEGSSAPPEVAGERGVVVWLSDQSEAAERLQSLEAERATETARSEAARRMIDIAPVPVWRRSEQMELLEVNPAYAAAVEANSPEDAVAAGSELLTGAAATSSRKFARQALQSGEMITHEETAIIAGRRARLRIAEVPLPSGQVAGFALDITDLAEAEDEIERHIEAQDRLFERLSAGVARFDAERQLIFANPAFLRIFQFEERLVDERPEFERVLEMMRDGRRLPEQRDFAAWKAERRAWFTRADGNFQETWVLPDNEVLRVFIQPSPAGGLTIVFEDESERLRLASSRDQLARVQDTTLQSLSEAVAVFGGGGRLEFFNKAFASLWRIPVEDLAAGAQVDDVFAHAGRRLVNGDLCEQMRALVRTSTEGRTERSGRFELEDQVFFRFAAVPLPDGNAMFTFDDITDTERVELALRDRNEALEAADKAKSQFVENMSYELRTPLTAISGFGEMLSEGLAGELSERQVEYVGSILTSAQHLRLMIDSIIDLAISDVGELTIDRADVDLVELLGSCRAMVDGLARDRSVNITQWVEKGCETIAADPVRLKQAVYNLLTNAVRHTEEDGEVTLLAEQEGDWLAIRVRDTGIGIPEAEVGQVFERFFKASNARNTSGFGLGLSLVSEVARTHGGTADIRSTEGEGTEATVRLPLRGVAPVAQSAAASEMPN